jgi:hypothetical protein
MERILSGPHLVNLPIELQTQIFQYIFESRKVIVNVSGKGNIETTPSPLLSVNKQVRYNILECCKHNQLQLLYTFNSPTTFISALNSLPAGDQKYIRLNLFSSLEETASSWTTNELDIKSLSEAWRIAVRNLVDDVQIGHVDFVITSSIPVPQLTVMELLHDLSYMLHQRTHGKARGTMVGYQATGAQLESGVSTTSMINYIRHSRGLMRLRRTRLYRTTSSEKLLSMFWQRTQ